MSQHLHSLAAHTGSRIDSAAKHNMACKVDSKLYQTWLCTQNASDADRELHVNRMRFAVQKDELVLNVSRKMFASSKDVNAYPLVVSNCCGMSQKILNRLLLLYSNFTPDDFFQFLLWLQEQEATATPQANIAGLLNLYEMPEPNDLSNPELNQIRQLPHFHAQGYALGTAYASFVSGDTVATVMIGGMMTVMNGAFTCHAGDMMQWYFEDEERFFSKQNTQNMGEGQRFRDAVDINNNSKHPLAGNKRYHDNRAYGMQKINDDHKSRSVFRIKPYRMYRPAGLDQYVDHYGDRIRIFAKCIGGGRPFEMVDVMLMTQSL
jgi:hypothetical protein